MVLYTNNTPQSTQTIAFTQPLIESNFTYLPLWANVDHYFSGDNPGDTNDGFHTKLTFKQTIAAPGFGTGVCDIYPSTLNGDVVLKFENATGFWSITGIKPVPAAAGYVSLAGGLILQWEELGAPVGLSAPYLFALPFPNNCFNVQVTNVLKAATTTSVRSSLSIIDGTLTNTGFTLNQALSSGTSTNYPSFFYMAIGN